MKAAIIHPLKCTGGPHAIVAHRMRIRFFRLLFACTTSSLALNFLACTGSRHGARPLAIGGDVAPGTLLIDVLEAGHPEHYWQYELQPATGTLRVTKELSFADYTREDMPRTFQEPAGAIGACAGNPNLVAISPNGTFSARCRTASHSDQLEIDSVGVGGLREWKPKERGIRGFAWAPNSRSIAILNVSSYIGMKPLELLAAFSGHPVPHDTVFLEVLDVQTAQATEFTIRDNVVSSFTRILNWSK